LAFKRGYCGGGYLQCACYIGCRKYEVAGNCKCSKKKEEELT
jgi:hypothetical protein